MAAVVSCIDDTDFHVLFGGYSPERADVDHVDAPRLGYDFCLRLDATVKKVS
jgi:hypothetical protein